jgi:prophage regulatory protein
MGSKRGRRAGRRPVQQVRILRLAAVMEVTGLSKSAIYKLREQDRFPKPVPLSDRAVGYVEAEILSWIESRVSVRDAATA